ncbi:MAG TPA: hypothetical protein VGA85_04430 [Dehalococcoidales bacterium]
MTTNNPQTNNDELEHKLDEIKNILHIQTTTASVFDEIKSQIAATDKKIGDRLDKIEKAGKIGSLLTVAAFAGSYVITGFVLLFSVTQYSKPYWFGVGLAIIGIAGFFNCYSKYKSLR